MENTYITIILSLFGAILALVGAILLYIFKVQNTLFTKLDANKKECRDLIDKNLAQDKIDKDTLERKLITLLDKHYVTNGQLNTLEQELKGEIKGLR